MPGALTEIDKAAAILAAETVLPPRAGIARHVVGVALVDAAVKSVLHVEYGVDVPVSVVETLANRTDGSVVRWRREENVAAPLAVQEHAEAIRLAYTQREDAAKLLSGSDPATVLPVVVVQCRAAEPTFAHRLVRLYFAADGRFAPIPSVLVDLSTQCVVPEADGSAA